MLIKLFKNSAKGSESRKAVLIFVLELNFIGSEDLVENIPDVENDSPFQIEGFEMPLRVGNALIRNLYCLKLYQMAFYDAECDADLAKQLLELVEINSINYFIISSNCNIIHRLIESLSVLSVEKQKILGNVVSHICCVVGYLPLKELTLIMCHLQDYSSNMDTVDVVFHTILTILKLNGSWKRNVVELGLVDTIRVYLGLCQTKLSTNEFIQSDVRGLERRIQLVTASFGDVDLLPTIVEKLLPGAISLIDYEQVSSQTVLLMLKLTEACMDTNYEVLVIGALVLKLQNWTSTIGAINTLKIFNEIIGNGRDIPSAFLEGGGVQCLVLNKIFEDSSKRIELLKGWSELFKNSIKYSPMAAYSLELEFSQTQFWKNMAKMNDAQDFRILLQCIWNTFTEESIFDAEQEQISSFTIFNTILLPVFIKLLHHYCIDYEIEVEIWLRTANLVFKDNLRNVTMAIKNKTLQPLLEWIVDPLQFSTQEFEFTTGSNFTARKRIAINVISILKELSEFGFTTENLRTCLADVLREDVSLYPCKNMLLNLMLNAIRKEKNPCYFSICPTNSFGYLKIEDFGRAFPPLGGYSITAWIRIQKYDNCVIRILTILDDSTNEILAIEIDENRKIVYRTRKGSVVYDKITVPEDTWIHLAFVHHKPVLTNSYVDIYTNGNFQGSFKCGYIGRPGSISPVMTMIGPHEKTESPSSYILNIGPISMLAECILDAQKISIMCALGFDYTGNWQGSWSSYMVGNKQLESKSTKLIEEEVHSPILTQLATFTMSPGSSYHSHMLEIPEDAFLFSISARNEFSNLSDHTRNDLLNSELRTDILNWGFKVVVNGCYTKLGSNSKITQPLAFIIGHAVSVCPSKFVDNIWTLGGCPILLRLIDQSRSSMELYQTFSILAYSVSNNWRSLAELERQQLYELLSFILKKKREFISNPVLDSILTLVGRPLEHIE